MELQQAKKGGDQHSAADHSQTRPKMDNSHDSSQGSQLNHDMTNNHVDAKEPMNQAINVDEMKQRHQEMVDYQLGLQNELSVALESQKKRLDERHKVQTEELRKQLKDEYALQLEAEKGLLEISHKSKMDELRSKQQTELEEALEKKEFELQEAHQEELKSMEAEWMRSDGQWLGKIEELNSQHKQELQDKGKNGPGGGSGDLAKIQERNSRDAMGEMQMRKVWESLMKTRKELHTKHQENLILRLQLEKMREALAKQDGTEDEIVTCGFKDLVKAPARQVSHEASLRLLQEMGNCSFASGDSKLEEVAETGTEDDPPAQKLKPELKKKEDDTSNEASEDEDEEDEKDANFKYEMEVVNYKGQLEQARSDVGDLLKEVGSALQLQREIVELRTTHEKEMTEMRDELETAHEQIKVLTDRVKK